MKGNLINEHEVQRMILKTKPCIESFFWKFSIQPWFLTGCWPVLGVLTRPNWFLVEPVRLAGSVRFWKLWSNGNIYECAWAFGKDIKELLSKNMHSPSYFKSCVLKKATFWNFTKRLYYFFGFKKCFLTEESAKKWVLNLWHPLMIIVFYYQIKTLISFWWMHRLNSKFLI